MSQPHRAQHRQSEGDYYADTAQKLQGHGADGQRQPRKRRRIIRSRKGKLLQAGQILRGDCPHAGENYANSPHEVLYDMVHKNLTSRASTTAAGWPTSTATGSPTPPTNSATPQPQPVARGRDPPPSRRTASSRTPPATPNKPATRCSWLSNHYSQQSAAAHYAKTNMPEPTGFNQQAELDKAKQQYNYGDLIGMSSTMAGIQAKQQQADAAHQQAVQVLQNLDGTYHETASSQPTYAPPPQLGNGDSTSVSGFHGTSSTSFTGTPTIGGTGGTGGTSGSYIPGGTTPPGTIPPGTIPPGTTPPGTTPPNFVQPGTTSGVGGTSFSGGNTGFRGTSSPSAFPRMTPDGLAMPGTTGGGTGGGDITRGKSGVGRAGTGFAGSRVSGGGYTGGPKETAGEGKAAGAERPAAKHAGERLERGATAAAAAKGKGSGAGAAGAGAGGKKKEDDKEHKNKYAVDEDVFDLKPERGPDGEKIVKPTIGEA